MWSVQDTRFVMVSRFYEKGFRNSFIAKAFFIISKYFNIMLFCLMLFFVSAYKNKVDQIKQSK